MDIDEFEIGQIFFGPAGFQWLCTDKGTRTITAIMLDDNKDPVWYMGPPYPVEEIVFDENKMKSCIGNNNGSHVVHVLNRNLDSLERSYHPGFNSDDVLIMMEKDNVFSRKSYPREKILTVDRVGNDGSIYHPYAAIKKDDIWYIKVFELFTKTYTEIDEDIFVRFPLSSERAMKKRFESLL